MTNTANTPLEALEASYPLRVRRLTLRRGTGGDGRHPGGDGIVKEIEVLAESATLTVLSDRRRCPPEGQAGGEEGRVGLNVLVRGEMELALPSKFTLPLVRGDKLRVETPSGGGWGSP